MSDNDKFVLYIDNEPYHTKPYRDRLNHPRDRVDYRESIAEAANMIKSEHGFDRFEALVVDLMMPRPEQMDDAAAGKSTLTFPVCGFWRRFKAQIIAKPTLVVMMLTNVDSDRFAKPLAEIGLPAGQLIVARRISLYRAIYLDGSTPRSLNWRWLRSGMRSHERERCIDQGSMTLHQGSSDSARRYVLVMEYGSARRTFRGHPRLRGARRVGQRPSHPNSSGFSSPVPTGTCDRPPQSSTTFRANVAVRGFSQGPPCAARHIDTRNRHPGIRSARLSSCGPSASTRSRPTRRLSPGRV